MGSTIGTLPASKDGTASGDGNGAVFSSNSGLDRSNSGASLGTLDNYAVIDVDKTTIENSKPVYRILSMPEYAQSDTSAVVRTRGETTTGVGIETEGRSRMSLLRENGAEDFDDTKQTDREFRDDVTPTSLQPEVVDGNATNTYTRDSNLTDTRSELSVSPQTANELREVITRFVKTFSLDVKRPSDSDICVCCKHAASVLSLNRNLENKFLKLDLCQECYGMLQKENISSEQASMLCNLLDRRFQASMLQQGVQASSQPQAQLPPTSLAADNRTFKGANDQRRVGKVEVYLSLDTAKGLFTMVLESATISKNVMASGSCVQVQTCLLKRTGSAQTGQLVDWRQSKVETMESDKATWSQLFAWRDINQSNVSDWQLEVSLWSCEPQSLQGVARFPASLASRTMKANLQAFNLFHLKGVMENRQVSTMPPPPLLPDSLSPPDEDNEPRRAKDTTVTERRPSVGRAMVDKILFVLEQKTLYVGTDAIDTLTPGKDVSTSPSLDRIKSREMAEDDEEDVVVSQSCKQEPLYSGMMQSAGEHDTEDPLCHSDLKNDDDDDDDEKYFIPKPRAVEEMTILPPRHNSGDRLSTIGASVDQLSPLFCITARRKFSSTSNLSVHSSQDSLTPPAREKKQQLSSLSSDMAPRQQAVSTENITVGMPISEPRSNKKVYKAEHFRFVFDSPTFNSKQRAVSTDNIAIKVPISETGSSKKIHHKSERFHSVFDSSTSSSGSSGTPVTTRKPKPASSLRTHNIKTSNRLRERRYRAPQHAESCNTLYRLVAVREKLNEVVQSPADKQLPRASLDDYPSFDSSSSSSPAFDGRHVVPPLINLPSHHQGDTGLTSAQRSRHVSVQESTPYSPSRLQADDTGSELKPEVQLSWSDNGRTTTITIKKVRNLKVDGSKTLPLGIYCKIHLFTRDGSKLKKKTKILPFSLNPTFNDTLTLSGSAKGGEMKFMICLSHSRVNKQHVLCSAVLVSRQHAGRLYTASSKKSPTVKGGHFTYEPAVHKRDEGADDWWVLRREDVAQMTPKRHQSFSAQASRIPKMLSLFSGSRRTSASSSLRAARSTGNLTSPATKL